MSNRLFWAVLFALLIAVCLAGCGRNGIHPIGDTVSNTGASPSKAAPEVASVSVSKPASEIRPGEQIVLLFWIPSGMFWNLDATVVSGNMLDVGAAKASTLAKMWRKCPQPGFQKTGEKTLFWLGSTSVVSDGKLKFDPLQIETLDGHGSLAVKLASHYQKRMIASGGIIVVSKDQAIKEGRGIIELNNHMALYVLRVPGVPMYLLEGLEKHWHTTALTVSHTEKEYNGCKYSEILLIPYPTRP